MNNPYIAALLALTSLSLNEDSIVQGKVDYEYWVKDQHRASEFKPEKKNCDLCVNLSKKRKTIKV
jgi:hypothetical protein